MFAFNKVIYGVFFVFAIVFISTLYIRPLPFAFVIKVIPALSLALLVFRSSPGLKGRLIGIGLIFSGAGDIFLELDRVNYFAFGLGAFLVAHLFYISAFLKNLKIKTPRSIIALVVIAYCISIEFLLFPKLGEMTIPVSAYVFVIMVMGVAAATGASNHYLTVIGASVFIISDSFIAVDKFVSPIPLCNTWVMILYFSAQFLIATGSSRKSS